MPSPPANAPVVAAILSFATGHTAPSTAAPTTLDAATSSNNQLCSIPLFSIPLQKRRQMEKYTKVALTIDEQIELLEGRGLDIPDT